MFAYHFMVNAFEAGTIVAVAGGFIGWFMVLRRQAFAGHTLALVGFPGAAAAVWLGVSASWGYFGFCAAAAVLIAVLPYGAGPGRGQESAGIGVVQAFALACGLLFISLYRGFLNGVNALLFGSFLGITDGQVLILLFVAVAAVAALAIGGRRLLFASIDPAVAAARGIPVRALSFLFLLLLGLTVAEISQITGTLLVFALLVMPAATAQAVTPRPVLSMALSIGVAVGVTWGALTIAYHSPYPIGFWITSLAFAAYVAATIATRAGLRRRPIREAGGA
jgi:zinc/manganese transport system permease protein